VGRESLAGLDWSGGDLDPFHGFIFVFVYILPSSSSPCLLVSHNFHPVEIIILSSSTSSPFLFHFLLALS
jgi:hypothetical protein